MDVVCIMCQIFQAGCLTWCCLMVSLGCRDNLMLIAFHVTCIVRLHLVRWISTSATRHVIKQKGRL